MAKHGEVRPSSPDKPVPIQTPQGTIWVYRLPRGKIGVRLAPGCRMARREKKPKA